MARKFLPALNCTDACRTRLTGIAATLLATWLSGCTTVGHDYHPPQVSLPSQWSEAHGDFTAADRERLRTWWRAFNESLDGSDGIERRHKLLLMLDEFPALGRLDFFETALAFMAGYGIRSFLIAQSLNQIDKAYGQNHSILDNCHVRVTFATNDERTAKRISETRRASWPKRCSATWCRRASRSWCWPSLSASVRACSRSSKCIPTSHPSTMPLS